MHKSPLAYSDSMSDYTSTGRIQKRVGKFGLASPSVKNELNGLEVLHVYEKI